jgi:hypothetical protein
MQPHGCGTRVSAGQTWKRSSVSSSLADVVMVLKGFNNTFAIKLHKVRWMYDRVVFRCIKPPAGIFIPNRTTSPDLRGSVHSVLFTVPQSHKIEWGSSRSGDLEPKGQTFGSARTSRGWSRHRASSPSRSLLETILSYNRTRYFSRCA